VDETGPECGTCGRKETSGRWGAAPLHTPASGFEVGDKLALLDARSRTADLLLAALRRAERDEGTGP